MRRLFVALMILMLPLRSWIGDVMAMELMQPALQAVHAHATDTPEAASLARDGDAHAMHDAHAAGHGHATPVATDGAADGHAGHGSSHLACTACQVCHSVAMAETAPALAGEALPHAAPQAALPHFASAEARLLAEPPIS
jgi:hypothetical protein